MNSRWPISDLVGYRTDKSRTQGLDDGEAKSQEGGSALPAMQNKQTHEDEPKDPPTRTDQARQVAEEYARDQREIIKKLRKPIN